MENRDMRSATASLRQLIHESRRKKYLRPLTPRLVALRIGICGMVLFGATGCRDLSNPSLPAGTQSPDTYLSRTGGLMLAEAAQRQFKTLWVDMAMQSGFLTDELTKGQSSGAQNLVDQRFLPEGGSADVWPLYVALHKLRGQARLARAVLAEYAPDISPAVRARLYAFEAYAEIWLADMYCSGVPLSTIDFRGDYTNQAPSTTDEVYAHAAMLFDSTLALAADSAAVQTLARVGKGRALLALAKYDEAEAAVANVQMNDMYRTLIGFSTKQSATFNGNAFARTGATVSDQEGINGLPFRSSGDPRTVAPPTVLQSSSSSTLTTFYPQKYAPIDSTLIVIAGGVDVQLIRAEAALQRGEWETWLSILNALRTTGTYTSIDTVYTDSTKTTIRSIDTVWEAGIGEVAGLRPLTDPGTRDARIARHFAERAAWLFITGQRQGDLRRLVRKYGLRSDELYPIGAYTGASATGTYESSIDVPVPFDERQNPLFHGCLTRD